MKRSQDDMKALNKHLGANLKAIRKHLKMSQPEMGAMLGISPQQWYKYESGKNFLTTADSALLIVAGIPFSWIYKNIESVIMFDVGEAQLMRYRFEDIGKKEAGGKP